MFRQIFAQIERAAPQNGRFLLEWHPSELAFLIERVWSQRAHRLPLGVGAGGNPTTPMPTRGIPLLDQSQALRNVAAGGATIAPPGTVVGPVADDINQYLWNPSHIQINHLIYAYLIENTRAYEIFQRVLHGFAHGERFGFPQVQSQMWLRATEELFYKDSSNWLINSVTSYIRPDFRATRRNAYQRLFGFDLNHGTGSSVNYPYEKPAEANTGFKDLLESFLREVYRGLVNRRNLIGSNDTSSEAVATAARRLGEMLRTRRQGGNLSREEFAAVTAMSWFHVVLENINAPNTNDAPIVQDMNAEAEGAADRLKNIGERVGYPAHPKSDDFFMLAENMSILLIAIENRFFDIAANAALLYTVPLLYNFMENIITHWDRATDGRIKATDVTTQQKRNIPAQGVVGIRAQSSARVLVP